MLVAAKILFFISVTTFFFLCFYKIIQEKILPRSQVYKRMQHFQNMDLELQKDIRPDLVQSAPKKKKPLRKLEDIPFVERVIIPAKEYIEEMALRCAPHTIQAQIQHKMIVAGMPPNSSVGLFVLKVIVFAALFGGIMFWAMSRGEDMPFVRRVSFLVLGALIGGILPISNLTRKIRNRQTEIKKQLPEVLDLLCVSVQAGLSFDAALRKIVVRMNGPFIQECRKMLDDVRMGMTRRDALLGLANRCEVQEVSLFVTSVVQAERLGSNMSTTLQVQAENVRERHRQWVKAMALKAPVKIVLPLVGCILPAIFIVALGPAVFNISKNLFK